MLQQIALAVEIGQLNLLPEAFEDVVPKTHRFPARFSNISAR
tara:strand:+ start:384 stop:509 length:126 start_codon:yes stop_codon:yes gene_type:complete